MKMLTEFYFKQQRKKILVGLALVLSDENRKSRKKPVSRVRQILQRRKKQGAFQNLVAEMRLVDRQKFFNYFRMSSEQFDDLRIVGPRLQKCDLFREDVLSPAERLAATLR